MVIFLPSTFSEIGRSWAQAWRQALEGDPERSLGARCGVADEEPQESVAQTPPEGDLGAHSTGRREAIG